MDMVEADAFLKSQDITIGMLREKIAAKADSADPGVVIPFQPLSAAATNYLAKFEGRPDEEVLVMTAEYVGGGGTITGTSPDYKVAMSIMRDFG